MKINNNLSNMHEVRQLSDGKWIVGHRSNSSITYYANSKKQAEQMLKIWDAAPELLEALIKIRHWYERNQKEYFNEYTPICFSEALSAILKATE